MNNCKVVGGKIANDNRNQTMTNLIKDAVENSSVEFKNKANLILISEINKNTKRFINFFNKELQDRGIDLVVDSIEDINSKINNSKNAKYNNLTRDILVSYLKHLVADVNNYNTVGIISNYGFTSRSARELGAEYVADLLFREIHANEELPKGQRLTHQKLIDKVRSNIITEFNIMFKNFKQEMSIKLKEEDEANKKSDIKTNNYSKYRRDIALYEKTVDAISNINKKINDATEIYNKNKTTENRAKLDKLKTKKSKLTTILNARKRYIINIHGNIQQKNFCAIATNINQPSFVDRIWSQSKISDYRNTYEDGFNNDFLESDDVLIYEAESIDETSKTWSDETKANFTNGISRDVKYQLSTIYKMALPFEPSDTNSDFSTNYDRDNLCGVPVSYNYRYVVTQLESNCKFDDIYTFIESVKVLATKNPNNYGFIELYDRMIKNATLSIRLFNQLKKPIVDKTMINNSRNENEKNYINNEQANARTSQYYDMINGIKTTYSSRSEYKAEQDKTISNAQTILNDASSSKSNNTPLGFISGKSNNKSNNLNDTQRKELNEIITNLFTFYFPHLNRITVEKSLQAIPNEDAYDVYKNIINKFNDVLNRIDANIKIELTKYDKYIKTLAEWYKDKEAGKKVDAKPQYSIYNFDVTNDNTISNALIYFAELVYKFDKNNVQLNSKNANGNLSSDLQNNCYISRIFDILKSGNMTALRNLKDEIDRCPQYKYNPLFYGLRDDSGKLLVHGLFNTETNDIDIKGVEMINVTLFDGIINETTGEGITYKQLTKNDYFITKLIKYFNPSKHKSDNTDVSSETCESFFNTPSDAPKNYTIRVPRFKFTDKKGIGTVNIDETIINNLVDEEIRKYIERVYTGKYEEQAKTDIIEIFKNKDKAKLTYLTDAEFSEFIQNRRKVNVRFNETINKDYDKTNLYKVLYKKSNKLHILYVQDSMPEYNKNKRNRDFTVNNADILDIVTFDLDNNVVNKDIAIKELVDKVSETDKSFKRRISEQAILNNEINFNVNKNTEMFMAFRQNIKSEINGFVNGLNALFVRDENGYYRIKSDDIAINNLLEKYHYLVDKKTRKRLLVKNGKLAGNVFNFSKLFPSNNYDAKAALETNLSLYGEGGLIKSDGLGLYINPENIFGEDSNIFVSINSDGKFILNDNFNLNQIVDNVVEQWLKSFSVDIVESYQEFNNVVDLVLKYGENTMPRIIEMILGDVLNNYFITELFSGEPTFYSDSRDYLKRAKEVQAGGETYAFYKIDEVRNSEIHDLENITEVLDFVDTKGSPVGIQARNGFKAITIRNSVSAISNADLIYKEVYDYNIKQLTEITEKKKIENKEKGIIENKDVYTKYEIETIAKVRATQIASRFGYGEKGKATKKNDAQSYITLEEFIRRRMADGTINDYKEIIDKIKEIRYEKDIVKKQTLINEFMLKNNAKIQVQKNFYFDMHYDSETGVRYPRQVKNAEFVLIPEFLEGTSLLELYNFMIENGIDQINTEETNKAAKRNILTFWDENGIADVNSFKEQLKANPKAVENYYYQYLYKQQDIVDHMVDEKNKAGVQILRKVKDNATPNTKPFVDEFEKNYIANIEESFAELIHSCGWKVNENGNISNIDGSAISFEEFFKKGKQQAAKLGLDSNFAEYFEIDEATKLPKIPVWMNSVSGKIESISQAIFNSVVTRQQLPGWHAAQVTGIGIGKQIADEKGVYHELKYHPATIDENGNQINEPYIEIMLPRWSKLLDGHSIEDIENGKCDIQIIYRMPTEGKQSVAVAKVVGILPDVYGSTVLVPDAWVTQTGSDFDVDTVYAMVYNMFKDKDGNIKKIEFDNDTSYEGVRRRYINYVSRFAKLKLEKGFYEGENQIEELNKLNDEIEKLKTQLFENKEVEKELYDNYYKILDNIYSLTGNKHIKSKLTEIIKNAKNNKENKTDDGSIIGVNYYNEILNKLNSVIYDTFNDFTEEDKSTFIMVKNAVQEIVDYGDSINTKYDELHKDIANYKNIKEDALEETVKKLNDIAVSNGIVSFDEFSKWDIVKQNSKKARENVVLDNFIKIMSHPDSREENYYSSNFDDISDANAVVKEAKSRNKVADSVYNPFVQIQNLEDAMAGAALKAFSVSRDTFGSLCNVIKAELSESVKVRYHKENKYDADNNFDKQTIESAYDLVENESTDEVFVVKHNRLNWSKNNRNVAGKLCTPYNAQTTAHSLDTIKEGGIYNNNLYTFGTFKTLIQLGIDYNTAISWLALPGIERIVKHYYKTNSAYLSESANPIREAIKELGMEYLNVDEFTPYKEILDKLKNICSKEARELGYDITNPESILTLDTKIISDRLQGNTNPNLELAVDLITILQFEKLHDISSRLEELMRCTNPDKFGAKQSIHETYEVVDKVDKYRKNGSNIESNIKTAHTILVDGVPLMDALYPRNEETNSIEVSKSCYPYIAAFYKYSTQMSVFINKNLFTADNILMLNEKSNFNNQLKFFGRKLTNDEYKQLREYLVHYIYGLDELLTSPVSIAVENIKGKRNSKGNIILKDNEETYYWEEEYARIKGLETTLKDVYIKDYDNPTQEEVDAFAKLTPVKKLKLLRRHYGDNSSILSKFGLNLFAGRNTGDRIKSGNYTQTISINIENENIEELYREFNNIISSKNPLIKLTAIDLIKYAFMVEGFRFTRNGITNVITNNSISNNRDGFAINGINNEGDLTLIQSIYNIMNKIERDVTNYDFTTITEVFDRFVRSHSEIIKNDRFLFRLSEGKNKKGFIPEKCTLDYNSYYFRDSDEYGEKVINYIKDRYNLNRSSTDPKNEHAILPRYIRLSHLCRKKVGDKVEYGEVTTLFRVCETPNGLLLIGVPKLDRNETYSGSLNQDNNKNPFNNKAYINPMFIDAIFNEVFSADINDELVNEKGEQIKPNIKLEGVDTLTFKKQSFKADKSYDKEDILFKYLDSSESKKGGANHLINAVNDFLANSPVEGISQEFMFLTLNPNIVNLLSKDDIKDKNNIIRIPNTNTYIKLTPKVITNTFMKAIRGNEEIAEKLGYGYKDAIRVGREQLSRLENKNVRNKDAKMYKVEILSRESADAYRHGNIELRSATTLLGFEEGATARQVSTISHRNFTGESQIALTLGSVIKDVLFNPASKNDVFLNKLRNFVQFNGIRVNEEQDITKYRKQLYDLLKDYYLIKGTEFLHKFDNYFANDDDISIDSEAIQQLLIDNPDGFNEFVKFLLDARNFGKEFDKFVKFINDENTNDNTFDEIVKIIKAVSENDKLSKAIKNVFNEYLATRFSTNPLVQNRLIDITMSFEDVSKMDKIFADVAELSNKEVQLVVKYVEAILDSSSQLDVPAKQREFSETYDKLIKEGADLSRIIDSSTGKFLQDFTEDFIKDKEKYSDDYHKAKNAMNVAKNKYKNGDITVEEYEQSIIDYYRTRLNRNIWIRKNIHQAYADSYYDEVNNNELNVLFNSSSYRNDIAKTFAKYIRLTEELNEIVENKTTFTDEEVVNIKTIKAAIRELLNPSSLDDADDLTGTLTEEQLKDKTVSDTLNEYLKNRSNINKKYFEYIVSEEWKATKNMYEQYIKNYDKLHPDFNIIDKLNDTRYKEAYNWLFVNSKRELNNKGQAKLNKAIEDIHANIEKRKDVEAIFEKDKAFDEYGNKDPRKLSKESIDKIKEITQQNNNLINVDTENKVIKELPKDRKVIITNRKFRDLLEPFNNTKNLKKQKVVKRINEILIKGVEKNTGNISTKLLWENTTIDERKELAKLFKDLNEFKSGAKKEQVEKLKKRVNFKTNREAYERNKNEAILLNLSEEDMKVWEGIFSTFDKELGKREPNRFMFGYIEIKDKYDTEYLDKEKTDAINFLSRNTNRRPTVYYYLSRNEAIENDRYEEWFNENHYYNTYTNRIEPLTIWTETEVVPGAEIHGEDGFEYNTDYTDLTTEETIYEYNPTFDNKYRQIREEYINKPNGQEYNKYDYNYRTDTGYYNNTSSYKGLSNEQKEATEALRQLLIRYAKEYAFTNQAKAFVNKGFLPRQYVPVHNAAYFFKEAGKFIGIDGGKGQPKEYHNLDYSKDELPTQSMYTIIKNKGFRDEKPLPKQPKNANEEELKVYYEELDRVRKENAKIREDNLKFENAVRSNDWKGIFNQLISTGEDYKSRQKAKNVVYLLLEDLKSKNPNDSSKAFKRNKLTGKLIKTDRNINNPLSFEQVEQDNLYHVVSTWARRVIYSEYKEPHKLNNFARIAQNIVSSKYMTFNFPGGIANVSTGFTNIFGEMFAGTYFDTKNVKNGWWKYHTGAVDYIRGFMFNMAPKTKAGAILKLFNVVDYDRLLNRTGDETLSEISEKIRNSLFVFQSGGEHFMQNVALLALLDSHRVYQHTRRDGKVEWKVGTFNNYIWDIEQQAMRIVLKEIEQEIGDEDSLTLSYENFVNFISKDIEALDEYDSFKKDFNREFIKTMYEGDKSEIAKRYREKVKELKKNAKEEFESKYNTFYNEFEFDENGGLRLKADSVFRDKSKPISDDPFDVGFADKYKDSIFGAFRNKVKKVNNKIHGVYDKLGAASIESTHWLGSLIMQYHKHIYPGLMKRYRGLFNRGYYNEMRESVEMGSYATLVHFLGIEFDGLIKRTKNDVELNNSLTMLAFLKETILSIFNTFKNLSVNWNTLKDWEIANMRRVLGDLLGCVLAFGSAMLIYAGTDDDELEDNIVYATMLYLTDRIYSEARMYTPLGLVGEAKTLWSSPIAVNNTILDMLKLGELGIQWIFDDEFNPTYTTGLYKGENKFVVRFGRNVPIYRIINRVANMDKNNKYYRIGQKGIHKKAKTIADYINGD